MDTKQYDVIVIGSGGGSKLVRPVADLGHKVALVEKDALGGTCLNRGCIPSKMLIQAAHIFQMTHDTSKFDIHLPGEIHIDFEKFVSRVTETIEEESSSIEPLYNKHPNVDLYRHHAHFVDNHTIEVNGEHLRGDKIFIAVGARAHIPNIKGLDKVPYFTYTEALRNTTKPKKMIVIGAGYIACELGNFYGALGTEVHFLVRSSMLRNEDKDIRTEFEKVFPKYHNCHFGATPTEVRYENGVYTVTYQDQSGEHTLESDSLFVATGIQPWTDQLGLENTEIVTDKKGFIDVDDHLRTSVEGVWALGDCIGKYLFRHTVNFEGEYLFRTLFGDEKVHPIDYWPVPHAVFTYPEIAGVGKTEDELISEGVEYFVGSNDYKDSAKGMALLPETGFVKLLFEASTEKLIGAHILGDEASNMIHMLIAFMNKGATLKDLLQMIYIHPALPEIVRNAARKAKAARIEVSK